MNGVRVACGWCPMQLPDDHDSWYLHFLVEHNATGYSVRFYPAATIEQELAALTNSGNNHPN